MQHNLLAEVRGCLVWDFFSFSLINTKICSSLASSIKNDIFFTEVKMFLNSFLFFSFSFSQVGDFPERDPFEDDEI